MSTTVESAAPQEQPVSTSPTVRQTAVFELTIQTNTSTSPQALRRTIRTKARPVSMRSKENVLSSSLEDVQLSSHTSNNTLTDSNSSLEKPLSSSTDSANDTQLSVSSNSIPDSQSQTTQTTNTFTSTNGPIESPSKTKSTEEQTTSTHSSTTQESTTLETNSESQSSSTNISKTEPVAIPETKKEKASGSFFMASPSRAVTEEKPRRGTIQMSRSWSEEKATSPSSSPNSTSSTPTPTQTTPSSSPSTASTRPSGGKKTETGTLRFGGFLRASKNKDKDSGSNNTSANNSLSEEHDALNDNSQLSSSPSTTTEKQKKRNIDESGSSTPREKKSLWRRTMKLGRSSDQSPSTSPSTKSVERTTSTDSNISANSSDNDIRPSTSDSDITIIDALERIEDMDFSTLEVEIPEAAVSAPATLKLIEDYLNNHTVNVGSLSKDEIAAIQKSPTKSNSTVTSAEVDVFRRQQLDRYEKDVASQKEGKRKDDAKDSWKDKFKFSKSSSKIEQPPSLPKQKELLEATIQTTTQENEVMRRKIQELKFLTNEKNALNTMTQRLDRIERSGKIHSISVPNSQVNSQAPSVANSAVNSKANSPSTSPSPSPALYLSPISASQTL